MNIINKIYFFIGILLLVCVAAVAQTPPAKPTVTTQKFTQRDAMHVDMQDADVCVEAGRFYYEQAFKAGSLEEASVLLNQSITLLQRALELRTTNAFVSERAIIHNHLADSFMAAARLFPNDIRTATAYYRKAADQYDAILEDCKSVNDRNKDTVAEAAYRMAEILFLLNDDQKAVAAAEIAWTNGWKEWNPNVVNRLNDSLRSGVATSHQLPLPTKRATATSIVLFPLNVLPDMLGEAVCTSCLQGKRSLSWFHSNKPLMGFSVVVAVPIGFAGGMIGGVQEAWRGYPFWNTRSIRMMKGQEYPSNAYINEW
jgi:tetratricopeptide (TPR) repeat protein